MNHPYLRRLEKKILFASEGAAQIVLTKQWAAACFHAMSIAQIEEAAHRGLPFSLKVADGDRYEVPHPDYIFLPPKESQKRTYVVVHNDDGFASILPLIRITSLTYKVDAGSA